MSGDNLFHNGETKPVSSPALFEEEFEKFFLVFLRNGWPIIPNAELRHPTLTIQIFLGVYPYTAFSLKGVD